MCGSHIDLPGNSNFRPPTEAFNQKARGSSPTYSFVINEFILFRILHINSTFGSEKPNEYGFHSPDKRKLKSSKGIFPPISSLFENNQYKHFINVFHLFLNERH